MHLSGVDVDGGPWEPKIRVGREGRVSQQPLEEVGEDHQIPGQVRGEEIRIAGGEADCNGLYVGLAEGCPILGMEAWLRSIVKSR